MADHLITSTDLRGLRALGLQGERVSAAYAQLSALLRARLGPTHAALFAEPQAGADDMVDWYAAVDGPVTPLVLLDGDAREAAEARIGEIVADIETLATALVDGGRDEEVLLGRMLRLAIHLPAADRIYMVGDQPVAVCWGYVEESAAEDAASALVAFIRTPSSAPVPPPQPTVQPAPVPAAVAPPAGFGWQWALLLAGLAVAAILGAWLLRDIGREPVVAAATVPPPDPAPPVAAGPPPRHDELAEAIGRARDLRVWLAGLEHQLAERKAACEPPELIVPASLAGDAEADGAEADDAAAPEAAEPAPDDADDAAADDAEATEAADDPEEEATATDGALVIPDSAVANAELAFLEGCWQSTTDLVNQDDVPLGMRYCFAADGSGDVTVTEGEGDAEDGTLCKGPVRATISPNRGLIIATDEDIECEDGSSYSSWRIECTQGDGGAAACAGAHGDGGTFEVSIQR
ncbi:MAG: SrfA family protein [Alphaproteobacteria bacterium]